MAERPGLLEEAARIEGRSSESVQSLGHQVDALLADQAEALWSNLDDGLRDWRTASAEQEERLAALKGKTRCQIALKFVLFVVFFREPEQQV